MKKITKKMIELIALNNNYSTLSCFDYEKEYKQIDMLTSQILNMINDIILKNNKLAQHDSYKLYDCKNRIFELLQDHIIENDIQDPFAFSLHSLEEYIDIFIIDDMQEEAQNIFNSFYYFLNEDIRKSYIKSNYLQHHNKVLYTSYLNFVIVIEE